MAKSLILDISELESMRENYALGALLIDRLAMKANEVLLQGNQVLVMQNQEDSPPKLLHTLTSPDAFDRFWDSFFGSCWK